MPQPCYRSRIEGDEYRACAEACRSYWANSKPGVYGAGFANEHNDPFKATRIGMLGEMVFGKMIGQKPDFSYRKMGDDGDFVVAGCRIDVKTAVKKRPSLWVYRVSEVGAVIELKSHVYVAQYLEYENRVDGFASILTVGWISRERLMMCELMTSKVGSHKNLVAPYELLKPVTGIIKRAKADQVAIIQENSYVNLLEVGRE